MKKVYDFSSEIIPPVSEVGGKAGSLIKAAKAGLPVPGGIALTAGFFDEWVKEIKRSDVWADTLKELSKENCDRLKGAAEKLPFTAWQKAVFTDSVSRMKSQCYAVRSSSPEEDLEGASFAGMYETFLGVTADALEAAVARAFASMLDYRVMEYKRQRGISIENPRIAVIIQKQLDSEVSGIGFSVNPLTNCFDEVMINASFGLGEYIVSGKVTPDSYIVDSVKQKVISKKINKKTAALYLLPNGRTGERKTVDASAQALADMQILQVTRLIKKCEAEYGMPVDTEWAYEKGRLYLLQARPVTTVFPLYPEITTAPGARKELYFDLIKASQGFQWSMSSLGADMYCKFLNTVKQGMFPLGKEGVLFHIHGRVYFLIGNLAKVYSPKMAKQMICGYDPSYKLLFEELPFEEYLPGKKPENGKGVFGDIFKFGIGVIPSVITAKKNYKKAIEEYYRAADDCMKEIDRLHGSSRPFEEQTKLFFAAYSRLVFKIMPVMMAILSTNTLKKMFAGANMEEDILALNMDLKGNPTSDMGHLQLRLAADPEFRACVSYGEFADKLANGGFSKEFVSKYKSYMKLYGCRGIGEIDISRNRTWETPESFFTLLKQLNDSDNALEAVKRKKQAAYERLHDKAKELGKEKKFLELTGKLEWTGLREHPKYIYVYAVDVLRQNALKIAESFVQKGRLEYAEDIFLLTGEEISKAQQAASFDILKIVNAEKKARMLTRNVKSWPAVFNSRGEIFSVKKPHKEGELSGEPVSPGIIRGKAKVLLTPFEKKLEQGEILVTVATEPSWTPIFLNASGVIMEVGGALQHGAIIAREYGLPCVTGIEKATELIKDGDMIEVNGTEGIVRLCR